MGTHQQSREECMTWEGASDLNSEAGSLYWIALVRRGFKVVDHHLVCSMRSVCRDRTTTSLVIAHFLGPCISARLLGATHSSLIFYPPPLDLKSPLVPFLWHLLRLNLVLTGQGLWRALSYFPSAAWSLMKMETMTDWPIPMTRSYSIIFSAFECP